MAAQVINHFGQMETVDESSLQLYMSLGWRYLGPAPEVEEQHVALDETNSSDSRRRKKKNDVE